MTNQLSFTCPVFNVETKFAHCAELRHRFWRGDRIEVRKGCQACMASNKCPVAREIAQFINRHIDVNEVYHSDQPKLGKLRAEVLKEIRPVVVQQQHLDRFSPSPAERQLIETANARIDTMLGSAPTKDLGSIPDKRKRAAKPKTTPALNKAAATGDLSAAINAAA